MSSPYVGECRLVGFNFAPVGWNFCNGALIAIAENDTLFNLIGTTYGGDGQQTFALPDLQGRAPVHQGSGFAPGQKAGVESVTLTTQQMPLHSHPPIASGQTSGSSTPQGNLFANGGNAKLYFNPGAVDSPMNAGVLPMAGGNQPHDNMQPYLVMNWIISLFGVFPSPN